MGILPWAFPLVIFRSVTWEPKWEVNHLQIFPKLLSVEWKLRTSKQKTSASLEAGNGGGWERAELLPQRGDRATGLGRPRTCPATGLRSFGLKPCHSVLASSRAPCRGQGLILKSAKAKMAGMRLLQIFKLSLRKSLPSHPHSTVVFARACYPGTKLTRPAVKTLAVLASTWSVASGR